MVISKLKNWTNPNFLYLDVAFKEPIQSNEIKYIVCISCSLWYYFDNIYIIEWGIVFDIIWIIVYLSTNILHHKIYYK